MTFVTYQECQRTQGELYSDWCHTNLADGNQSSKAYPYLIDPRMLYKTVLSNVIILFSVFGGNISSKKENKGVFLHGFERRLAFTLSQPGTHQPTGGSLDCL